MVLPLLITSVVIHLCNLYIMIFFLFLHLTCYQWYCRFLLEKTIDVLLYVDRLDTYRMDTLDEQVIRAITTSFGKAIWRRTLVVLTHAQLSPPDGLDYNDFLKRRSDSLLRYIRSGAGIGKRESAVMCIFTCYIIIPIILYAISAMPSIGCTLCGASSA
jgi:hypothetical protein